MTDSGPKDTAPRTAAVSTRTSTIVAVGALLAALGGLAYTMQREPARPASPAIADTARPDTAVRNAAVPAPAKSAPAAYLSPLDATQPVGACIERSSWDESGSYSETLLEADRRSVCNLDITADSNVARLRGTATPYAVRYKPIAGETAEEGFTRYTLHIEPVRDSTSSGARGARSYFVDSVGRIHYTDQQRAATLADPMLTDCLEARTTADDCRPFRWSQRWGTAVVLPPLSHSISGTGTVTIGEILHLLPRFNAEPGEEVKEYRIAWSAAEPEKVVRPGAPEYSSETLSSGATMLRLRHQYVDTGYMEIRFTLVSTSGQQYRMRDTVRVVPGLPPQF